MKEQSLIVQKMQDYIKEHLSEEITLSSLANVACYSPWDTQNPRIQLEPIGHRGYIEFMPICK